MRPAEEQRPQPESLSSKVEPSVPVWPFSLKHRNRRKTSSARHSSICDSRPGGWPDHLPDQRHHGCPVHRGSIAMSGYSQNAGWPIHDDSLIVVMSGVARSPQLPPAIHFLRHANSRRSSRQEVRRVLLRARLQPCRNRSSRMRGSSPRGNTRADTHRHSFWIADKPGVICRTRTFPKTRLCGSFTKIEWDDAVAA
jgi:hypothetical protein